MPNKKTLAIIGFGRFGSFWAKQLLPLFDLKIYDADLSKREKNNYEFNFVSLQEALNSDYIYLTIPIRAIENFLISNVKLIPKDAVIVDAASIKTPVVNIFKRLLDSHCQYMFTHPLFGPDSGANGLDGLSIAVLPGNIDYQRYNYLISVFDKLNLNILPLSADEHDYLMAYNLNLIHLLGRTLAEMGIEKIPLKMNALTYLNGMSKYVVNDSKVLFEDFFYFNPYAKKIKTELLENLKKIIDTLP